MKTLLNYFKLIRQKEDIMKKFLRRCLLKILNTDRFIVKNADKRDGTEYEGNNMIDVRSEIKNSFIGRCSYVSYDCKISKAKIGRFCSIGPRVFIGFSSHPTHNWVTTHPAFYINMKEMLPFCFHEDSQPLFNVWKEATPGYLVNIGSDVWIGADVKIMDGCSIGNGAIIAAGSVVTKDIPPYAIVGGVPSKIIRYRFADEEITFLNRIKWWNKPIDWIANNYRLFEDIKIFMKNYSDL